MTGRAGLAAFERRGDHNANAVYLQLEPHESRIIQIYRNAPPGDLTRWTYWKSAGIAQPVSGPWTVKFVDGGPSLPAETQIDALTSWTHLREAGVEAFSGTAAYTASFARPTTRSPGWQLDLGKVSELARVKLNGREMAALLQAPYRIQIPDTVLKDQNTLEIEVTNLAANRIADLDRRDPSWKRFYNVNMPARRRENAGPDGLFSPAKWAPRESGLLGPVTLTPLRELTPER